MTGVSFWNSMGRTLESFEPVQEGRVAIYTCGPTVYSTAHIGNLRAFLFEDVLCRSLTLFGYEVEQVMNLTDVEDKIIKGAVETGRSIDEFTAPHIESFFRDLGRLHVAPASRYPRATEHLPEMIALIESLLEKGYAYEADDCVFFRIESDEDYGRLSGIDPDALERGQRVADDEYSKENVRDFVLWKGAKPDEPSWPSPWGVGRPGWHLECSAMSMKYLGDTLDIHCGGVDNAFPHHENEIAQSESVTGKLFSRFWLHCEHLLVDGEKMSKSLGNQYDLDDLLERGIDLRAVRYLYLSVHYRQRLNFTFRSVENSVAALKRVDEMRFRLANARESAGGLERIDAAAETFEGSFREALADDLNLSRALGSLHTFVRDVNSAVEAEALGSGDKERTERALRWADGVLGVLFAEDWQTGSVPDDAEGLADDEISRLVGERAAARDRRDFAEADRIRDHLAEEGVVIEDLREGARWKRI